jgi:hypothetical protein
MSEENPKALPHVVTALIAKRDEIVSKIEGVRAELRQLTADLDNIDAAIRIFDPDIDLGSDRPKPLPPPYGAYRGEMARVIFDALRAASEPLSTLQIAHLVMAERGLDTKDQRLLKTITKRVGDRLAVYREQGRVRSLEGPGQYNLWELAR